MADSFEDKLKKAKEILDILSEPEISLENSMKEYKKGMQILKEAANLLENAKIEYEEISKEESCDKP